MAKITKEFELKLTTAIIAALGFVIALSWNEAIRSTINSILDKLNITQNTFYYKILAAVIITIICTVAIVIINKVEKK